MDTEKKTGERIGITLALLACVGFSAFLIWLQQSQENDRQQLTQQVQDSGQREEQTEGSGQIEIRSRVTRSKTGDQPVFSLPGGFYPEDITVEIAAPAGSSIYYTLDGTVPDPENGILYEAPVEITNICGSPNVYSAISTVSAYQDYAPFNDVDKAVVLQAVAVDAGGRTSNVTCASYFVAMEARAMYRDLPVLSLTVDPVELFDYFGGNYVTGVDYENALAADDLRFDSANYYRGGEMNAHVEYFEADRYLTYEGEVTLSLRKDGNLDYGQKSFLMTGADPVPESSCELYELFRDGTFLLYGGGTDHVAKNRQVLEELLLKEITDFTLEERKGCLVFVDGEFWGLYLMGRVNTAETFARRAGGSPEEIQVIENRYPSQIAPEYGELYRLVTEGNTSGHGTYQKILEQMDLESYLDYYCANLYFGNSQFDSFSTTLWRRAGEGETGKWHWEFSDATDTLGRNKVSNYSVNTYLCPGVAEDLFLQGLLKNKDFQTAFRQRMREYVEELTKEKAEEYLTPLLETYRVAVTATAERYGLRQTEEGYLADGDTIQKYFASRGEYILRYTEELITLVDQTEAPDGVQETVTESAPEE